MNLCKIWGFHGGDYEEWCLLGHGVTTQKTPFFRGTYDFEEINLSQQNVNNILLPFTEWDSAIECISD
jgi:hypothetical protein